MEPTRNEMLCNAFGRGLNNKPFMWYKDKDLKAAYEMGQRFYEIARKVEEGKI